MADCSSPCELVTDGWSVARSYATSAFSSAEDYLATLQATIDPDLITDIPQVDIATVFPDGEIGDIVIPDVPVPENFEFSAPTVPTAPTLAPVGAISPPVIPEFISLYPDITLPVAPTPLSVTPPGDAPDYTTPSIPGSPTYDIPTTPTLRELELPDAPTITLPTFTDTMPTESLVSPEAQLIFSESLYSSTMLTEINDKLLDDIQNGTAGLPQAVETQLWDRARSREHAEGERGRKAAVEEFAARGFSLPPGALASRLQEAEQEVINKDVTLSREVYINQAERALQQLQFALTTALQSETQLMNYSNSIAQRALEVQTTILNASIQIFNGKIQLYNAQVSAYQAAAGVFKTRIEGELAKLQIFESELAAQKLIGEMNLQELEAYKSALTAVQTIVEVYKTEMQASAIEADVQKLALEAYRSGVDAYKARVEAKATEFQGYQAQVEGELAKIRLYEGDVNAYNGRINGYRAYVDALVAVNRSDIEVNEATLRMYLGKLQAFSTQTQAEVSRIQAESTSFDAQIKGFSAELGAQQAQIEAEATEQNIKVQVASTQANLEMKAAEVNIQRSINALQLVMEALKSGATVSSGLAQAALSAVSLSGAISGSSSTDHSTNINHNYDY